MKRIQLTLLATLFTLIAFAQNDKLLKHDGKSVDVKVLKVSEFTITFTYPNETAEQSIGKYAVKEIDYASGRKESVTDKVQVAGEDDWENVVIVEDKAAVEGLKKLGEIRGKTNGLFAFHTAGSADKKSMKKLKAAAAELGGQFVLLTSDKDNQFTAQSIKKGIAYSY